MKAVRNGLAILFLLAGALGEGLAYGETGSCYYDSGGNVINECLSGYECPANNPFGTSASCVASTPNPNPITIGIRRLGTLQ